LAELAKELGCSQAQLVLAWAIANKDVTTAILGFSRVEQIDENIGALKVLKKWNKEIEDKIEALLGNTPAREIDFKSFG